MLANTVGLIEEYSENNSQLSPRFDDSSLTSFNQKGFSAL